MTDELDLFRQQLKGVAPIKQDRHLCYHTPGQPSDAQLARRASASAQLDDVTDRLSDTLPPQLKPNDLISYKKSGIQEGVFKKLRLGKYPIGDRIDLHQLRLAHARIQILKFIRLSQLNGHRCVLIIHGKGEKSTPPARMKSYVCHWLPQLEEVLALHTAQPMHGGYGAIYVLLRKSVERKIDNQERHARHLG